MTNEEQRMSREKQIEEIAAIIEQANKDAIKNLGQLKILVQNWFGQWYASAFYEAGCRMQSEGEWEKSEIPGEEYVCSVCGCACWYYDVQGYVAKSRFCPNCGAKMKGV